MLDFSLAVLRWDRIDASWRWLPLSVSVSSGPYWRDLDLALSGVDERRLLAERDQSLWRFTLQPAAPGGGVARLGASIGDYGVAGWRLRGCRTSDVLDLRPRPRPGPGACHPRLVTPGLDRLSVR